MGFMKKSNESVPTRKIKTETDPSAGNRLSILLLIIPIVSLIVAANSEVKLPIDQMGYSGLSLMVSLVSFAVLAYFSFRDTVMTKTLRGVLAFLLLLWCIGNFMILAQINMALDKSPIEKKYVKVMKLEQTLSSSGTGIKKSSSRSCTVWIDKPLVGMDYLNIRYDMCDEIETQKDGLLLDVRNGYFNMPWVADYSVIKDFDTYIERLGIQRGE